MKTITCRQLEGSCDAGITAATKDEMMAKGMEHMHAAHPEAAKKIEAMPENDPVLAEWMKNFEKTWESTPENK